MEKSRDFLSAFNDKIIDEMKREDVLLIGDISLDDDSYRRLEEAFSVLWKINYRYFGELYKESLILLLVKNAERNYSGNFWGHLKFDINLNQRDFTRDLFSNVCERYNFPTFETEAKEGYGIITPYICHSGIPNEELSDFFAAFDNYFDNGNVQAFINQIDQRPSLVRRHTKRFLDYLGTNQFTFILQWDEVTSLYNDVITAEEILKQLELSFEGELLLIPLRFIQHYIDWQKTPTEQPGRKSTKKHRYRSPKITLNWDARCLVLNIPEQEIPRDLNPDSRDKLIWIIEYAGETFRLESIIYKNGLLNKYLTDEESLKLRQPQFLDGDLSQVYVQVYFNDVNQLLQSWELVFAPDEYIVFDDSGKMLHSNQVSKKDLVIFAAGHIKVVSGNIDFDTNVAFWPNFRLYTVSFGDLATITLENNKRNKKFTIEKKPGPNIPELLGGVVFHNNPSIYQELPHLVFPDVTDDSLSVEILHVESKDKKIVKEPQQETNLSQVIEATRYGTYNLRIKQENRTIDRKRFYYIPEIRFDDEGDYWPEPKNGYKPGANYRFATSKEVHIKIDGLKKENELVEGDTRKVWFKADEQKTRYHGRITLCSKFSENEINIDFQMAAKPILWAIESSADTSQPEYTDQPIYFTDEQIRALKEPYLLLSAGDLGCKEMQGKLIVTDGQGNDLFNTDFQIKSGGTFSFPLTNLILSDAIRKIDQYQVSIQLFSPYGELIGGSTYPLVIVRPTIDFSHFNVELQDDFITFSWRDNGMLTERGMFLADLTRPWNEAKYYPIFEDHTIINLPQTELEYGIYSVKIDVPKRQNPFGRRYFEPTVWSEIFMLEALDEEMSDSLESFNYHWLSYLLFEDDDTDAEQKKKSSPKPLIQEAQQAMNLVKTYLTIKTLDSRNDHITEEKKEKFLTLERVYRNLAREVDVPTEDMLRAILNEDFSPKDYFDVFSFFELVQLTDQEIKAMNWIEVIHKISDQLPDLAFQIAMATNNYYRYVERWIGRYTLSELLELQQGEDPIEVMQEHFEHNQKWARHPDYWGSYQDVLEFFNKYHVDMRRGRYKNMAYQEYLAHYEEAYKKGTRKLFDKSFIWKRQDLQHEINSNASGYTKLLEYLAGCVRTDIEPYLSELRRFFPKAMDRISNIINPDGDPQIAEDLIYNTYLIMFVVTLYRQGKWSYRQNYLLRNADRIRRYFPEMYNHTLVVFDLYLRDGGQ